MKRKIITINKGKLSAKAILILLSVVTLVTGCGRKTVSDGNNEETYAPETDTFASAGNIFPTSEPTHGILLTSAPSGLSTPEPSETVTAETPETGAPETAAPETTEKPETEAPTPTPTPSPTPTPEPTPAPINGIVFSKPAGYYSESAMKVSLESTVGGEIYYTRDCSEPVPGKTGTHKYTSEIIVRDYSTESGATDRVNVIKAVSVKNGEVSKVFTATYILNNALKTYTDRYGKLGVFSISTDDELLFGENGIYTNYTEHGRQTEKMASVEFFESDGSQPVNMLAGIRIYGGTSRALAQKSFKLVARKEYSGDGKFRYAFFPDNTDMNGDLIEKYNSLILRSGGNDSLLSGDRATQLRDAVINKLAKQIENTASQDARPVVVYLNGAFWGIYFLREDLDNDYLEEHYKVNKDKVSIITYGHENGEWFYEADNGPESYLADYQAMLAYITENDMSQSADYQNAATLVDMDNLAKYMAVNIYANNRDWPHNNLRMWRYIGASDPSNPYTDGKWRFMLKDIDYSWGRYYAPGDISNVAETETAHNQEVLDGGGSELAAAFSSLLKNAQFRRLFFNAMNSVMNEYYSYDTVKDLTNEFTLLMTSEMPHHLSCTWGGRGQIPLSYSDWRNNINNTLLSYAQNRATAVKALLTANFSDYS